jgi:hypothetical protein
MLIKVVRKKWYVRVEKAALRRIDQAGQPTAALSVGPSGGSCSAARLRLATVLSPQVGAEGAGESTCGSGPQAGNPAVDHAARSDRLRRVLSPWTEAKR